MNGLCRAIPTSVPVRLRGSAYTLAPLRLADMAAAEAVLLARRDVIGPALDLTLMLGDALGARHLRKAQALVRVDRRLRECTLAEVMDWFGEVDGMGFLLHRGLERGRQPALATWEEGVALAAQLGRGDFLTMLRTAMSLTGLDFIGSLDWAELPAARRPDKREPTASADRPIPWKRICRKCALDYGWTPEAIGQLTWWQLQAALADDNHLGGVAKMSAGEALAYAAKKKAERAAAGLEEPAAEPAAPADDGPVMHAARKKVYEILARERAEKEAGNGKRRQ